MLQGWEQNIVVQTFRYKMSPWKRKETLYIHLHNGFSLFKNNSNMRGRRSTEVCRSYKQTYREVVLEMAWLNMVKL